MILISLFFLFMNLKMRVLPSKPVPNIYSELGVSRYASQADIHSAFKQLSKILHPDRNPDSADRFLLMSEYYDVLSHPQSRFAYDKFGIIIDSNAEFNSSKIVAQTLQILESFVNVILTILICLVLIDSVRQSLLQILTLLPLVTYLVFIKDFPDIFDLLFPGIMTFELIEMFTGNLYILYTLVYVIITFINLRKYSQVKRMKGTLSKYHELIIKHKSNRSDLEKKAKAARGLKGTGLTNLGKRNTGQIKGNENENNEKANEIGQKSADLQTQSEEEGQIREFKSKPKKARLLTVPKPKIKKSSVITKAQITKGNQKKIQNIANGFKKIMGMLQIGVLSKSPDNKKMKETFEKNKENMWRSLDTSRHYVEGYGKMNAQSQKSGKEVAKTDPKVSQIDANQ